MPKAQAFVGPDWIDQKSDVLVAFVPRNPNPCDVCGRRWSVWSLFRRPPRSRGPRVLVASRCLGHFPKSWYQSAQDAGASPLDVLLTAA